MKTPKKLSNIPTLSPDSIDAKESDYLYIKDSQIPNAGKGLYTSIPIFKNEIISVFKGKLLSKAETEIREKRGEDRYFIVMLDGSVMDSMKVNCFAKYANDAEGLISIGYTNNATITLDDDNRVCLVAICEIASGEEIFCSYGRKYWKKHGKLLSV